MMRRGSRRGARAAFFSGLAVALSFMVVEPVLLPAAAQTATLPPAEKVTTFLGIDLPLLPGERLTPIGSGDCSAIIFAPREEKYQHHKAFWDKVEWFGPCRFGLAHGAGALRLADGRVIDRQMLYGLEWLPVQERSEHSYSDGSGKYGRETTTLYLGNVFSDLTAAKVSIFSYDDSTPGVTMANLELYWGWDSNVRIFRNDSTGQHIQTSISEVNPDAYCANSSSPAYKAFAGEIRKACGKKTYRKLLERREGNSGAPWAQHKITAMYDCPLDKTTKWEKCSMVLRKALGNDVAFIERVIAGDAASRQAATQEVFNRFAPLEAAVEARARLARASDGAQ